MEDKSINSIKVSFTGVEELKKYAHDVIEKAEELEQAVQRLNDVEIKFTI